MVNRAVSRLVDHLARSVIRSCLHQIARMEALRWALARGARNGRSAEHFARHWGSEAE